MSNTPNLIALAASVREGMGKLRELLPGLSDEQILTIASVLSDAAPPPPAHMPPTLFDAVYEILSGVKCASRGEIVRSLTARGWDRLSQNKDLYGTVGRILTNDQFEKMHRGMYRRAVEPKKPAPQKIPADLPPDERKALEAARELPQPFYARQLAEVMGGGARPIQVSAYLRALRNRDLVKRAGQEPSGTRLWAVV